MWLEMGMAVLLLLTLAQSFVLFHVWRQSRQLQQQIGALWQGVVHAGTDVPTSMLVTALGRVERQLGQIGQQAPQVRQSYELAQQLARDGVDIEQLIARCGLSRDEARLVLQMHPVHS
ncbi:DUF2802 domain-containing protein [Rhodanobacter sp. Col0626]|uniref:DUF2802 domain-containing protein n=1 Tax=Rhodanobacter sp. Col0626 TaxID=3415679 RepID=UPI003CE762E9